MEFIKSNLRRRGDEQQQRTSPDGNHAPQPYQNAHDNAAEERGQEMAQQGRGSRAPTEGHRFSMRFPVIASRRVSAAVEQRGGQQEQEPGRPSEMVESPKTPQFNLHMPALPSTRLHLPNLARTWTRGESGPESRPPTSAGPEFGSPSAHPPPPPPSSAPRPRSQTEVAGPAPGQQPPDERPPSSRPRSHTARFPIITLADGAGPLPPAAPRRSHRNNLARRFRSTDPAEMHLADLADRGRRRRRHRRDSAREDGSSDSAPVDANGKPKRFLFCFPWVASRRMRGQILRVFVSGLFLLSMLATYLALSLTRNISNGEFTILLILIILANTVFFCHSLVRLCIYIVRPASLERLDRGDADAPDAERAMAGPEGSNMFGPGGYAIPRRPIRVLLARDEEAAGLESETAKLQPPAYGLWRESVRVDPNRIYWARNDQLPPPSRDGGNESTNHRSSQSDDDTATLDDASSARRPSTTTAVRPPSYASEDGVAYVVEARPRSMAPLADGPPPPPLPSTGGERLVLPEHRV